MMQMHNAQASQECYNTERITLKLQELMYGILISIPYYYHETFQSVFERTSCSAHEIITYLSILNAFPPRKSHFQHYIDTNFWSDDIGIPYTFLREFSKFRENKILTNWRNHSCRLLIKVNHALVTNFSFKNMCFNAICENKILAKISEFTADTEGDFVVK